MTMGMCGGLQCTSHAYRVVWGACGSCVMGLVWSYGSHSLVSSHLCSHHVRHWVGVNVRCEQVRCRPQPTKVTTTHVPGVCLGTTQTTWDHVITQCTAVFTAWD